MKITSQFLMAPRVILGGGIFSGSGFWGFGGDDEVDDGLLDLGSLERRPVVPESRGERPGG